MAFIQSGNFTFNQVGYMGLSASLDYLYDPNSGNYRPATNLDYVGTATNSALGFSYYRNTGVSVVPKSVSVGPSNLYGYYFQSRNTDSTFVYFFDSTGNPVVGSDQPVMERQIPTGAGSSPETFSYPRFFQSGIQIAITTGILVGPGAAAPLVPVYVELSYR